MLRYVVAALGVALLNTSPGMAQSTASGTTAETVAPSPFETPMRRRQIGYGRLFSNDAIGDGKDRWRTGSWTISRAFGYSWDGAAPARFGQLLETRVQGQVIAPDNLQRMRPEDRPYAGTVSLGLHTHANYKGLEMAVGGDLVFVGPQTHMDDLHSALHRILGKPEPSDEVLANQIGNDFRPTAVAEMGRSFSLGQSTLLRPFAELRAGDETLARVGADFTFGSVGRTELFSRESITGQRYRVVYDSQPGTSFTLGGDLSYVSSSIYLPEDRGYEVTSQRERVRAGFHWQGKKASAFYGLTYLGKEFEGQSEGQVVGSLRVKLRF